MFIINLYNTLDSIWTFCAPIYSVINIYKQTC